jgi:hypothetical protein
VFYKCLPFPKLSKMKIIYTSVSTHIFPVSIRFRDNFQLLTDTVNWINLFAIYFHLCKQDVSAPNQIGPSRKGTESKNWPLDVSALFRETFRPHYSVLLDWLTTINLITIKQLWQFNSLNNYLLSFDLLNHLDIR